MLILSFKMHSSWEGSSVHITSSLSIVNIYMCFIVYFLICSSTWRIIIAIGYFTYIEDHNINASKQCPPSIKRMGCYHQEDNIHAIVRKDCVNERSNAARINCRDNSPDCKICYGRNCNFRHAFQNCVSCDSRNDTKWLDNQLKIKLFY